MADTQPNTMTAADVKKTDATPDVNAKTTELHQNTNPEVAPNIPVTGAMGTSGHGAGQVVPGTATKNSIPTNSLGAGKNSGKTLSHGDREQREKDNAAQRAKWQEENTAEPVKAVADQAGKF
jgi:hypothetical protein